MKAMAGLLGALIGLLIVAGIAVALFSRSASGPANAGSALPAAGAGASSTTGPAAAGDQAAHPEQPVSAPVSREEQLRNELSRKRIPYYRFLHDNFGDVIDHFSVLDDPDTLDLVLNRSDDNTLMDVVQRAVAPRARDYGFRRVRLYVRNPSTAVAPFTVIAEATDDGAGHWSTFKK